MPHLALSLVVAWIVVFYSLIKGVKSSGKVNFKSFERCGPVRFTVCCVWLVRRCSFVEFYVITTSALLQFILEPLINFSSEK